MDRWMVKFEPNNWITDEDAPEVKTDIGFKISTKAPVVSESEAIRIDILSDDDDERLVPSISADLDKARPTSVSLSPKNSSDTSVQKDARVTLEKLVMPSCSKSGKPKSCKDKSSSRRSSSSSSGKSPSRKQPAAEQNMQKETAPEKEKELSKKETESSEPKSKRVKITPPRISEEFRTSVKTINGFLRVIEDLHKCGSCNDEFILEQLQEHLKVNAAALYREYASYKAASQSAETLKELGQRLDIKEDKISAIFSLVYVSAHSSNFVPEMTKPCPNEETRKISSAIFHIVFELTFYLNRNQSTSKVLKAFVENSFKVNASLDVSADMFQFWFRLSKQCQSHAELRQYLRELINVLPRWLPEQSASDKSFTVSVNIGDIYPSLENSTSQVNPMRQQPSHFAQQPNNNEKRSEIHVGVYPQRAQPNNQPRQQQALISHQQPKTSPMAGDMPRLPHLEMAPFSRTLIPMVQGPQYNNNVAQQQQPWHTPRRQN